MFQYPFGRWPVYWILNGVPQWVQGHSSISLFSLHAFACLHQCHIKLPLKTHVSTICQRRRGLACSETRKRHKVSATSEAIPLEISYGVVKWELWNFTVCIRVEGSSQSIVSPGLQIHARPQSPFHLRKVLLDNTGGMPVQ